MLEKFNKNLTASGVSIRKNISGNGAITFRVRLGKRFTHGKVFIRDFTTEKAARDFKNAEIEKRQNAGFNAFRNSPQQLGDAEVALAKLDTLKLKLSSENVVGLKNQLEQLTLVNAVDFYIAHNFPASGAITFHEALPLWLVEPRKRPLSPYNRDNYEHTIDLFTKFYPDLEPRRVTKDDIVEFLNSEDHNDGEGWAAASRKHHLGNLSTFFRWCVDKKYTALNPCSGIPKPEENIQTAILTPKEAAKLLSSAHDEMVPAIAIGLFAGLRVAEIKRLDWSEIDIHEDSGKWVGHLEVKAHKSKTQSYRKVRLQPNLIEWLKPYARERGSVAPLPPTPQSKDRKSQKPWGDSYWVESFNRVKTAAGWRRQVEIDGTKRWRCNYPRNAMRHSFGSYFMSTNGDDASATAAVMGNSPQVVHKHYLSLVRDTIAREYFSIVPTIEESKIIRFSEKHR